MKTYFWRVLVVLAVIAPGCRSAPQPQANVSSTPPVPEITPNPWEKMTFVDKPDLQTGTGPMDSAEPPAFSSTSSGLRYRILRQSNGEKPTRDSTVTVQYRGWLNNGKVFDSSYERGKPTTFALTGVIKGWTEGMQLVGEGGMIELWVPSRLGYGRNGSPGSIPPHSNLHFIVELENVH